MLLYCIMRDSSSYSILGLSEEEGDFDLFLFPPQYNTFMVTMFIVYCILYIIISCYDLTCYRYQLVVAVRHYSSIVVFCVPNLTFSRLVKERSS